MQQRENEALKAKKIWSLFLHKILPKGMLYGMRGHIHENYAHNMEETFIKEHPPP